MAEALLQHHDATLTQAQVQTMGFTQLSRPIDNGDIIADVVFVHGLGGHPKDTWTYASEERRSSNQKLDKDDPTRSRSFRRLLRSKGIKDKEAIAKHPESLVSTCFWPMDLLSRDFKNVRVLTYGYDSHVSNFCKDAVNQVTISQHGRTLLERLIDERQDCLERPLIFVAHSLGGLLVKDAIIESRKHSPQTVARMVFQRCHAIMFFGTPHLGSGLADWGVLLSNIVEALGVGFSTYKGVLRQLAPDSEKLESLTREFNEILNAPIPVDQRIKIYSFQEGKGISGSKLLDGKVVPDHSSWFNRRDLERNISISENHKNMCKFKGDNDPGYKAFSSGLRIYLSEILHSKETQTTRPGVEHDEAQPLQIQCGPAVAHALDEIRSPTCEIFAVSQICLNTWADFVSSQSRPDHLASWFLESPEYQSWRTSENSQFLWCTGKPSVGKSSIAATLVSELSRERIHSEYVAHFFFQLPQEGSASFSIPAIAVCSIIAQLLHTRYAQSAIHDDAVWLSHKERAVLLTAFKSTVNIYSLLAQDRAAQSVLDIDERARIATLLSQATSALRSISEDDLFKILASLIHAYAEEEIHIVIDGADILLPDDQSRLLKNFRNLWKCAHKDPSLKLRILIMSRPLKRNQEILDGLPYLDYEKEQKECLRSLNFGSSNTRRSRVIDSAENTDNWVLRHPEYIDWKSETNSTMLWIQGKARSRKSALMQTLLQELTKERSFEDVERPASTRASSSHMIDLASDSGETKKKPSVVEDQPVIASFFCGTRESEIETSHRHMLQTLLYEVLAQESQLYPWFQETYRKLRNGSENHVTWSYEDLKDVFINLVTSCDQHFRIYLLVDALDESDEGQLADVLSLFHDDRGASACTIKIAFTSRPSSLIAKALTGTFKLVLGYENKLDIAKMVDAELRFLSKPYDGILEWCTNYFKGHAQGVFFWIFIIIRNLKGWDTRPCTKVELMKLVQDFPFELIDYYKEIIEQLAKHEPTMKIGGRKIPDWVTYAERPLTAGEIWDSVASMTWLADIWIKLGRGDEVAKLFKQRRLL